MAAKVILSVRMDQRAKHELEMMARRQRRSSSEMGSILLNEALRTVRHPMIRFRDTAIGRQASVMGTRLLVWHVMMVARDYSMDPERVAIELDWPLPEIHAAFAYTAEYPDEIWDEVAANNAVTFEDLAHKIPGIVHSSALS